MFIAQCSLASGASVATHRVGTILHDFVVTDRQKIMNNHIGHLERVRDFTVQTLKQDIDKNLPNKESIFMKKNRMNWWKNTEELLL